MPHSTSARRDKNRSNAQSHFSKAVQQGELARQEREKEHAALLAKMAKLRALRLAKEAADHEAASKPEAKGRAPRKRAGPGSQ